MDGALFYQGLHAAVEVAVAHGEYALSVVVVENVFKLLAINSRIEETRP